MLRKVAVGLAAIGALNAAQVKALGLGEVTVHSSLNQPLNAEIDLLQIRDLTSSQIVAGLAEADEFYLAGVKPTAILSDLSFELDLSSGNGRLLLKTREPIREPFLNFLVEVNWPTGRLVKEYTLLLDPPVFSAQDLAPRAAPSAPMTQAKPAPVMSVAPQLQLQGRQAAPAAAPMGAGGQYRVGKKDTLWQIALNTRPDESITPQQMMLALQRTNPDAFADNNINRLRSGVVLDIPTRAEIDAMGLSNPVTEVQRQNRAWRQADGAGKPAGAPKREPLDASKAAAGTSTPGESESQLRIVSTAPAEKTAPQAAPQSVSSDTATQSPSELEQELLSKNLELEEQLVVTLEGLDKVERDNAELFSRLEQLSEQMASMQRLIELKDQQLAELQNRQMAPQAAPESAPMQKGMLDTLLQSPAMLGGIGAGLVALLGGLFWFMRKRKQDEAAEEQAVQEAMAALDAEEEVQAAAELPLEEPSALAADPFAGADEAALAVEEDPNDPFNAVSDDDVSEFSSLGAGDELDMDLKIDEPVADDLDLDQFSESLLSDEDYDLSVDEPAAVVEAGAETEVESLDDLAFNFDAAAPEEALMADDLDDELEAILAGGAPETESGGAAAELEPDAELDDELGALLAETDAGSAAAEASASTTTEAALEDDFDVDLDALLAETAADAEPPATQLSVDGEDYDSLELDTVAPLVDEEPEHDDELAALLAEDQADGQAEEAAADDDEVDLAAISAIALEPEEEALLAAEAPEAQAQSTHADSADELDLDDDLRMGELLLEEPEPMAPAEPEPVAPAAEPEEADQFDSLLAGLPESDEDEVDLAALASELDAPEVTLSLEDGDDQVVEPAPAEAAKPAGISELVLDDNLDAADDEDLEAELNLMLEQEDNGLALEESGADEALDYLEDADEVGTKLDLARAYVDMDDREGAADILAEVIKEGSDEQVAEAKKLLETLNS